MGSQIELPLHQSPDQSNKPNENGQQLVSLTPVELGAIQDNSYQVISGLETGDRIAISNILKLKDGAPIDPES